MIIASRYRSGQIEKYSTSDHAEIGSNPTHTCEWHYALKKYYAVHSYLFVKIDKKWHEIFTAPFVYVDEPSSPLPSPKKSSIKESWRSERHEIEGNIRMRIVMVIFAKLHGQRYGLKKFDGHYPKTDTAAVY